MTTSKAAAPGPVSISHVLFDLDGTLVDSTPLHDRAFRDAMASLAPKLISDFRYERYKGVPTREVFARMGVADEELGRRLTRAKQENYQAAIAGGHLAPFPGAVDIMTTLRGRGFSIFVVTGSTSASVKAALGAGGLSQLVDGVVTAEDVSRGKPAPDCYLECLARFGLRAEDCIVVEDAKDGVEAAHAAALDVWGVHEPAIRPVCDWWAPNLIELAAGFPPRPQRRGAQ